MEHKHKWRISLGSETVFAQCMYCGEAEGVPIEPVLRFIRREVAKRRSAEQAVETWKEHFQETSG